MRAYADTSVLISLYGRDANSLAAVSLAKTHQPTFILTPFGEAEFSNALELRLFRKEWTASEARAVRARFLAHLGVGVFELQDLPQEVWPTALRLSRRHTARLGARTLDILHVASAFCLKPDAFLTFDERQRKLARALGIRPLPR